MSKLVINGDMYEIVVHDMEMSSDGMGQIEFKAPSQWKPVNKCDSCHRFEVEAIVLHSIEELLEHGWIREVNNEQTSTNARLRTDEG